MNTLISKDRRAFLVASAAAGGGLALGLKLPFGGPDGAEAADAAPEVNAWVLIRPDDSVVIRIARSEMGQGTLTGLAQMVAEELECDWSKVSTEFPTPGQSLARNRVWNNFFTAGSQGIRQSNEFVRKGIQDLPPLLPHRGVEVAGMNKFFRRHRCGVDSLRQR